MRLLHLLVVLCLPTAFLAAPVLESLVIQYLARSSSLPSSTLSRTWWWSADSSPLRLVRSGAFEGTSQRTQELLLPFAFPFFGAAVRRWHIDPRGALHALRPVPNCPLAPWVEAPSATQCDLNRTHALIAPFFTVFNSTRITNEEEKVNIWAAQDGQSISVEWRDMQLTETNQRPDAHARRFSFAVALWSSGRLEFHYANTYDPRERAIVPEEVFFMAGLRDFAWRPALAAGAFAEYDVSVEASEANDGGGGFFLPLSAVVGQNKSVQWCRLAGPQCAHPTGPDVVSLSALSPERFAGAECLARSEAFGLSCLFNGTMGPSALYNETTQSLDCVVPSAIPSSGYHVTLNTSSGLWPPVSTGAGTLVHAGDDSCTKCEAFLPSAQCALDCHGDRLGSATLDDCRVCSGGQTGLVANSDKDCAGVCFGPHEQVQGKCLCSGNTSACPTVFKDTEPKQIEALQAYQLILSVVVSAILVWKTYTIFNGHRAQAGSPSRRYAHARAAVVPASVE